MSQVADRLRAQAEQCLLHGSPLTAVLLHGAAREYDHDGPTRDLLLPYADEPRGSVLALRLAGALHRLVLQRAAPELALHYPSVGGTAPPEGAWSAARAVIADHADQLREGLRRPVQTNEVGRSAVLYGALRGLRQPVRLLEIGTSAGLNLQVDRFAYVLGDGEVLGDPDSPVRLVDPWRGQPPAGTVEVVSRAGCDVAPLDPASTADRLTLTSYVWADQGERFARLRAALVVASRHPVAVERSSASEFLARELAAPVTGVTTVVWHSLVRQYLGATERAAVDGLLRAAGARATAKAPLVHLRLEPDRIGEGHRFLVELTTWPGGATRVLGEALGHGPPVTWS